VNPAFSKGVYRQYKLKIVESLIIQPKIGLQFKGGLSEANPPT